MRLTATQIAMYLFLGESLPFLGESVQEFKARIKSGHEQLVRITGEDFGSDPQKWHEYLAKHFPEYRWSNKHLGMPKLIAKALSNQEWRETAQEVTSILEDER